MYCGVVLIGGALLAPWLHAAAQLAGQYSSTAQDIAGQPFHRFVNRSMLGLALLGIWPLMRGIGVDSWRAVGLAGVPGRCSNLAAGYALGFGSLACVAAITVAAGVRHWVVDDDVAGAILTASASAVAVAIIEEVLFRGALFGAMRTALSLPVAIITSSVIYAVVHFFEWPPAPETINWASGIITLIKMLAGFTDVARLVPTFFTLLLAGVILASAYQYTGALYFSIGLHAGWIFWLKMYRAATTPDGRASTSFWGTGKMIDGWLAVVIMGLLLVGLQAWRRREVKVSHAT
jgi:membrane protease YdiL (CAAX protease family)